MLLLRLEQLTANVQSVARLLTQPKPEVKAEELLVTKEKPGQNAGFRNEPPLSQTQAPDTSTKQTDGLANQIAALPELRALVQELMGEIADHRAGTAKQLTALEERTLRLVDRVEMLLEGRRALSERVDQLIEDLQPVRRRSGPPSRSQSTQAAPAERRLPRQLRLRTSSKNDPAPPAPAPPQASVPARQLVAPPPLKVQVTTYQKGEPPKHREIGVRLGGRFF